MISKLKAFLLRHQDIFIYLIFGVLTTIVNYIVYYPLYNWGGASAALSNCIAWVAAVVFAFVTNKPFVFRSIDWSAKTVLPEFFRFVGCRLASGLIETAILYLTVDLWQYNGNILKLLTSVFVVVLNYFSSKLIVFVKKK